MLTPNGVLAHYVTRPGTSDGALVAGIIGEDEYRLRGEHFTGWAIDIGAHIGTVAIALALDNPTLQVVAVEDLPENADVLLRSVAQNGLLDRVFVENAAAGSDGEQLVDITYGWSRADDQPDSYMADNRYIGGLVGPNETSTTIRCPVVSLASLLAKYGIAEVDLLKIDCEGCEWFFLRSPAISAVRRIKGEMHEGSHGTRETLHDLLDPYFDVFIEPGNVAHFEAARRA